MLDRRSLALLLLTGPLLACEGSTDQTAADASIRRALSQQAQAWNQHDARAWVADFAEDAEFVNIMGTLLQGRPEIERRHAEIFSGIFARTRVEVTVRQVRVLAKGAAIAETDYALRGYDRLPPGIRPTDADGALRTRMKYVWQLRAEGWRVVSAQNTAVLPSAAPVLPPALGN